MVRWYHGDGQRAYDMLQRIEQAGDRMVVTGGGVIHDMRCDGTAEHGVNDVAERDFTTRSPSWQRTRAECMC